VALAALLAYLAAIYVQPAIKFPALAPLRPVLVLSIFLMVAAIAYLVQRRRPLTVDGEMRQILIFLAYMALCVVTAYLKVQALEKWLTFAQLMLVVFLMINIVDTLPRLRRFLYGMLAIHVLVALDGLRGFYTAGEREEAEGLQGTLSGFLGDTNDFALAMLVMVPYAYFLAAEARRPATRLLLRGVTVLYVLAAMFSFSRGGFLTLLAVLGCFVWRSKRRVQGLAAGAVLALALVVALPSTFWARMGTISEAGTDANAQTRLLAWQAGLRMWTTNPLFGMGPGNFQTGYRLYKPEGAGNQIFAAHSIYFQVLGELGVGGLSLGAWLVRSALQTRRAVRRQLDADAWRDHPDRPFGRAVANASEASLLAFLVGGAFLSAAYYPHFWFNLAFTQMLAVGVRLAAARAVEPRAVRLVNRFNPRPGQAAAETP
jgi:probable O-glycosylation ligase (exosortase A-associated)